MKAYFYFVLSICCISCALLSKSPTSRNGSTFKDDTKDYFHGDEVMDPYRWLEDSEDDRVVEWVSEQSKKAEKALKSGGLSSKINQRIIEIEKTSQGSYNQLKWAGERLFAIKRVPPAHQSVLVAMPSYAETGRAETLIDPNLIDPTGLTAIDAYYPSHDGRYLAVSMSKKGTEAGDLYIYDLKKRAPAASPGKPSPAYLPIERVIEDVHRATGGGAVAWNIKTKGFFYTRYSDSSDLENEGSLQQKLYFHKLGKDAGDDKLELGDEFDGIEQIELEADPRSGRIIATVRMGLSGQFKHFLRNPDGKWQQLSDISDELTDMTFAPKGGMYMLSRESAPRGRLQFLSSPKVPLSQAKRVVPESNQSIVSGVQGARSMLVTQTRIYLIYQLGGPAEIRVFDQKGKKLDVIRLDNTNIGPDLIPLDGDEILFRANSFTEPTAWYRYDGILGADSLTKTDLSTTYGVGYDGIVAEQIMVVSEDGAKVPLFVVKKAHAASNAPAILIGDGGFGRAFTPEISPALTIWMTNGGLVAFAGVRGGGEFGEGWHRAGMQVYKQNSIDDFTACAHHLIQNGYTSSNKLALWGSGNGGLLAGAAMVQHPDMASAVVLERGIFDMLRLEFTAQGEIMMGEYGTVNDKDQFKALLRYSPYHNVERAGYPATLLISGANDLGVLPWHSRKFAAQLQSATTSQAPILYKEIPDAGSRATPFMQRLSEEASKISFVFEQLGVAYR